VSVRNVCVWFRMFEFEASEENKNVEFTGVIEHFFFEGNEKVGHYGQTLINYIDSTNYYICIINNFLNQLCYL